MKKGIYKMYVDCGRMGKLEGLFVSTDEKIKALVESQLEVYFGEVLGKHSEVCGVIEHKELELVSDDESVISVIEKFDLESGRNPFNYTYCGEEDQIDDETVGEYIDRKFLNND